MHARFITIALSISLFAPSFGCHLLIDDPEEQDLTCVPWERDIIDPEGDHSLFVVDSVQFAVNAAEATELGIDYDRGEPERRDNTLGSVLGTVFGGLDKDINAIVEEMVLDGRILHLIDVQASTLDTTQGVGVSVFLGIDSDGDPTDNFSGSETFDVSDPFAGQTMAGHVISGNISAEQGSMPLQIALPGSEEPFVLNLAAARIEAAVVGDGLVGVIGGVLSEEQVANELMPIAHIAIARTVSMDCDPMGCVPDSAGATLVDLLDTDMDFEVTLEELVENDLIQALTAPDLDMFDGDGQLNPNCDRERESLSLSVGFTAVPAQF